MGLVDTVQPLVSFAEEALPWLPHVARYARLLARDAADADDLVQETFLRAYQNWHTYRRSGDCRRWLFTICRHVFLRDRKRASRFVAADDVGDGSAGELHDGGTARGIADLFDRIDIAPAFERGLHLLPHEYRETIMLVDVEGYSYADVANLLAVPIGTVRSRLFRARRQLQRLLIEYARDMGWKVASSGDGQEETEQ
jgi:RNA polymerase sigma-70 factor (ECF subfamily)